MRKFSFRPAVTLSGRKFHGIRGFQGKPFHPPLTDIPIGAYTLAAVFDLISFLGKSQAWSHDFYRAATFCLIGGGVASLGAAVTGFFDWLQTTEKGTQARRTVNAHAWTMLAATGVVLADLAFRWFEYWGDRYTPVLPLILSLVILGLITLGGTIGGELVFDYGFNVEMVGEVWEKSERDVLPGQNQ